jgi:ABC-2 type transport system permease protein
MTRILRVLRMEFKTTAANKAFIIITILGPFLLLLVTLLPTWITRSTAQVDEATVVGVVGADRTMMVALEDTAVRSPLVFISANDKQEMEKAVLDNEIQAFIVMPADYLEAGSLEYYSVTGTDFVLRETVRGVIGSTIVTMRLEREGLDAGRIANLTARPWMDTRVVSSGGKQDDAGQDEFSIIMTAITFTMLLYMTILLHGQSAARSVLKENTSKTVEIMLSSMKPSEMLFGKLLGQAAAGLLQYTIWVAAAALLIKVIGPAAGLNLPISLNGATLAYLVLFFILAFFIYSSMYAAIGSAAEDESHLAQLSWPVLIFLILPMVMSSAIIMNPAAPVVVFFSLFPLTSPIVMFVRILVGNPASWQIILSVGILIAAIIGTVFASAKIFRVGILMTGKRFKIGEVVKWIRYKTA